MLFLKVCDFSPRDVRPEGSKHPWLLGSGMLKQQVRKDPTSEQANKVNKCNTDASRKVELIALTDNREFEAVWGLVVQELLPTRLWQGGLWGFPSPFNSTTSGVHGSSQHHERYMTGASITLPTLFKGFARRAARLRCSAPSLGGSFYPAPICQAGGYCTK